MFYKDKIKEIRKRLNLTQEEFAAGLGVDKSFIGQIEIGHRKPGRPTIAKICKAYNIDPREFFETEKKPVAKKEHPLTLLLKNLPDDKKEAVIEYVEMVKDMSIEDIRETLKQAEKEKFWRRYTGRRKTKH